MTTWFPVFTLILGWLLKTISDSVEHRRTLAREREMRGAARRDQLNERSTIFQRQTLLDLQEAVSDLARATGAANVQDVKAYRQTGKWQKQLLGEDLSESSRLANRRTTILNSRVRDDLTRGLVQRFKSHANDSTMCDSKEAADSHLRDMAPIFEELNERIGLLLRQLDDESRTIAAE